MDDHIPPKKTLRGFLKFTYWDLPNTVFGGWALLWVYILPAIFFLFWQDGEEFRLIAPPRLEELSIIEGKAIFRTSRKALIIKLADGSEFAPNCHARSLSGGACIYNDQTAASKVGKPVKAWNHPKLGTLQVELDGIVTEGKKFERLLKDAMDTSSTDFMRLLCFLYALSMLLLIPLFSLSKFFKSGE